MALPPCALLLAPASERGRVFERQGVLPMTDVLGVLAASWGVLMALSPVLQVRRIVARRSSDDVSIGYLVVLQVGFALWIGYGLALGNLVIALPNVVALSVGLLTIAIARRYRSPSTSDVRRGGA
jgi:uncharacterized protein with PQ loop repeat